MFGKRKEEKVLVSGEVFCLAMLLQKAEVVPYLAHPHGCSAVCWEEVKVGEEQSPSRFRIASV